MTTTDTRFLSLAAVSKLIKQREVSPVELARSCFDRIDSLNGTINAFITVAREQAMATAEQAAEEIAGGHHRGVLHGVPIALKDLYATKGVRTTANSDLLADWIPDEDATTTRLLAEAGTVLLGKLSMNEFAFGAHDFEHQFQPARNPWNTDHVPGGSSSGAGAALAAGLCYGALGSDTGGSIRSPAAFSGIVGLKPTYGRVSRYGVLPLSWSLDHAGPMTRTVEDCAILLQAIAGYDKKDPASANRPVPDYRAALDRGVAGMRLGIPRTWFGEHEGTNPEVMAAFEEALKVLELEGAELVDVDASPFLNAGAVNTIIGLAEAAAYHEETVHMHPELLGQDIRDRLIEGALFSAVDYVQAQRARRAIAAQINGILKDVDAILSPSSTQPAGAFASPDPEGRDGLLNFAGPFNTTGLPAMSIPCGFSIGGLPLGLQIAGRAFDEATVLRIAQAYESKTDWHQKHPDI